VPLPTWSRLVARIAVKGRSHARGRLLWGLVKDFHDGSLGSRTALMWQPYTGARRPARLIRAGHTTAASGPGPGPLRLAGSCRAGALTALAPPSRRRWPPHRQLAHQVSRLRRLLPGPQMTPAPAARASPRWQTSPG